MLRMKLKEYRYKLLKPVLVELENICSKLDKTYNSLFASEEINRSYNRYKAYSGYKDIDIALLKRYMVSPESIQGELEYVTDFMGIKHLLKVFPESYNNFSGKIISGIPIPDDGFHSGTIEYVSCFTSIEKAGEEYVMVELGAGWGPWMSISGVAAKQRGIKKISLIGVEGEHKKIDFIKKHLTKNGLRPESDDLMAEKDNIYSVIYDGVISDKEGELEFPEVPIDNYGASLSIGIDARNHYKLTSVKAYSFANILKDYDVVDFVHIDLQGYEYEFIQNVIDVLCQKIKYVFIGTHSRVLEGKLLELMYNNGFQLLREQPCEFNYPENVQETLVNYTIMDGGQFWINSKYK